jgi:sulfite reductase beta subunit-like hemoprotein
MRDKVDMSREAVTARIKLACGLGDAERLATMIRSLMAEIRGEREIPELFIEIAKREGRIIR